MAVQKQRTGSNPVKVNPDTYQPGTLLRLQQMGRELRLTDQMLSLDVDSLSIVEGGPAPAWTSAEGDAITINVNDMPNLNTRRGIAVWLGTNAHELFHNLYTPRSTSLLMRRVSAAENSTDRGIHRSWNILEDQRIERLGLARYAPWRGYLVAALSHHIPAVHPMAWTLVAGRTWLTDEVRAIARATFVATNGEADAVRCAELIGAYQRLFDPGESDAAEAYDILTEFHGLFGGALPPRGSCGMAGKVAEGEPEQVDDDTVPFPTADEADEDEPDASGDDEGDEGGDEDADGDDGDDGSDADDGDGDDGSGDDESDDDGDGDSDEGDGDADDSDADGGDDADDSDADDGDGDGDGDGDSDESDADDDAEPGDGTSGSERRAVDHRSARRVHRRRARR